MGTVVLPKATKTLKPTPPPFTFLEYSHIRVNHLHRGVLALADVINSCPSSPFYLSSLLEKHPFVPGLELSQY